MGGNREDVGPAGIRSHMQGAAFTVIVVVLVGRRRQLAEGERGARRLCLGGFHLVLVMFLFYKIRNNKCQPQRLLQSSEKRSPLARTNAQCEVSLSVDEND